MIEKFKSVRFPILFIVGIAAVALIAYGGAHLFRSKKTVETVKSDIFGGVITTSFGVLTLMHANSETTVDGTLSRSTPCVHWIVDVKKIDTGVSIEVRDENSGEICVQSLGAPQEIHEVIGGTVPETAYMVNLEGTTVFQGALKPVTIPEAPTEGRVE